MPSAGYHGAGPSHEHQDEADDEQDDAERVEDRDTDEVRVDQVMEHAGVSFVNGQFMAGVEVRETNRGPLKFTACGFWGIPTTNSHAVLDGRGHTTFNGCHFVSWARKNSMAPCIHAKRGGLTVMGCDFAERDKVQLLIEAEVEAALVLGNRLRGKDGVVNRAGERAQVGLNLVSNQKA